MQRIIHTPEGVRDIYNKECEQKLELQRKLQQVFDAYGYENIETPTFEYFEVFSREVGTIPSKDLYKFFDREGNTLVLRPDVTPSVSRACASYYHPEQEPVSLCYTGKTFINTSDHRGQLKETTQMGVERFGDASIQADAEVIAMTVDCLKAAGLTEFQVSVGQVDYFKALLAEAGLGKEAREELRALISQKNFFGVEELLKGENLDGELTQVFLELPQLFGTAEEVLPRAKELTSNPDALQAVLRLEEIYELLKVYGCESYVSFDFGMLSKLRYYTGIIFQAFTYGTGEPVIKGGRYNDLMKHFGHPAAAVGFAITVESLMLAISRQNLSIGTDRSEVIRLFYDQENGKDVILEAKRLRAEGKRVSLNAKKEVRPE
ncbi:MAG: ATP phosphoribosyltransferase regulatory subunit [Blautia sp.]|nr:ATP phosphoribosyltransferase regulatory subunit [Blautia sp.]